VEKVNKDRGFQVGIHVDAASGGFIAPFQDRLPDVGLQTQKCIIHLSKWA
jgi:glutamate/tyrosine decarboxylase-like PLP-dependent enzyme